MTIEYPLPIMHDINRLQKTMAYLMLQHALLDQTKIEKLALERFAANDVWENSKQGQQAIENVKNKTLSQRHDEEQDLKYTPRDFYIDPNVDSDSVYWRIARSMCKPPKFPDPALSWTNIPNGYPPFLKRKTADYDARRTTVIAATLGYSRNIWFERADMARDLLLCNTILFRDREAVENLASYMELETKWVDKIDERVHEIHARKHNNNNNNTGRSV
jgi:hypothetical protein